MELLADANVLIDYAKTDPSVLALYIRHLGPVFVPIVILDEVEQLDARDCERLGLTVVEEPLEILMAAAERRGPLSFQDHVCLLIAKQNGWTCVTNEKPLHRACEQEGVAHIWGLRVMIELVQGAFLSAEEAMEIATAIHKINPRFITIEILARFEEEMQNSRK